MIEDSLMSSDHIYGKREKRMSFWSTDQTRNKQSKRNNSVKHFAKQSKIGVRRKRNGKKRNKVNLKKGLEYHYSRLQRLNK